MFNDDHSSLQFTSTFAGQLCRRNIPTDILEKPDVSCCRMGQYSTV